MKEKSAKQVNWPLKSSAREKRREVPKKNSLFDQTKRVLITFHQTFRNFRHQIMQQIRSHDANSYGFSNADQLSFAN